MITAINNYKEGSLIKINLEGINYYDLDLTSKTLIKLDTVIREKYQKSLKMGFSTASENIVNGYIRKVFSDKSTVRKFIENSAKVKEDFLCLDLKVKVVPFYRDLEEFIFNVNPDGYINYESIRSNLTRTYNVIRNEYAMVNNYIFHKKVNENSDFKLLGVFLLDLNIVMENDHVTNLRNREFHRLYNSLTFVGTDYFFNKKINNFSYFKKILTRRNIDICKESRVSYEVCKPEIDSINSISLKNNFLKSIQKKALSYTFSSNQNLILC